jgi:hypothetical protein
MMPDRFALDRHLSDGQRRGGSTGGK